MPASRATDLAGSVCPTRFLPAHRRQHSSSGGIPETVPDIWEGGNNSLVPRRPTDSIQGKHRRVVPIDLTV